MRRSSLVSLAIIFALMAGLTPAASSPVLGASPTVQRLAGADRYATSAAISRANFAPGVPIAYLAVGTNFPDALAAGPAAATVGGPILLVAQNTIPAVIATELARLKPVKIVIVGGVAVVSNTVLAAAKKYATSGVVQRLAGADRYSTATAISAAYYKAGVPVVYVTTGLSFHDALVSTPAAVLRGGPLLLTAPTYAPASLINELKRLKPGKIVLVGSTASVSNTVFNALKSYTTGGVTRISSVNGYDAAAAVSRAHFPVANTPTVYIANGANFPDALSAGAPAARMGAPMLLVPATGTLPAQIKAELVRLKPTKIVVVGGNAVVSPTMVNSILAAINGAPTPVPPNTSKLVMQYFLIPHPDDEFEAWSMVENQKNNYPVFVLFTHGETTSYADGRGLQSHLGEYIPRPQPFTGINTPNIHDQRLFSYHNFLNEMALYDAYLDAPTVVHRASGTSGNYDIHVGPMSARVTFNLGGGGLTAAEVKAAMTIVRSLRGKSLPNLPEDKLIGASYYHAANGTNSAPYLHADHKAIHDSLWNNDYGTPGAQWARTGMGNANRSQVMYVSAATYARTMTVDSAGIRRGIFQRHYGWLAKAYWTYGETDSAGIGIFSRQQGFWTRH